MAATPKELVNAGWTELVVDRANILSCPYRDPQNYPVDPIKVQSLVSSYRLNGVWGPFQCRPHPTLPGVFERTDGEHRTAALDIIYPNGCEMRIWMKNLENWEMLQMMAHANLQTACAYTLLQTMQAALGLVASEGIPPLKVGKHGADLLAMVIVPLMKKGQTAPRIKDLAKFLGYTEPTVEKGYTILKICKEAGVSLVSFTGCSMEAAWQTAKTLAPLKSQALSQGKNEEQISKTLHTFVDTQTDLVRDHQQSAKGIKQEREEITRSNRKQHRSPGRSADARKLDELTLKYNNMCLGADTDDLFMRRFLDTKYINKDTGDALDRNELALAHAIQRWNVLYGKIQEFEGEVRASKGPPSTPRYTPSAKKPTPKGNSSSDGAEVAVGAAEELLAKERRGPRLV